jgi:hypothetical protein
MESIVLLVVGLAGLAAGVRLLARTRAAPSVLSLLGGGVLILLGLWIIIGGFWTGGRLVGSDSTLQPPISVDAFATPTS